MTYIFIITWSILALIDIGFTYYSIKIWSELQPSIDEKVYEQNKIPRFFIGTFGLKLGLILHSVFMILLIIVTISVVNLFTNSVYLLFGLGIIIGVYGLLILASHIKNVQLGLLLRKGLEDPEISEYVNQFLELNQKRLKILNEKILKNQK